MVENINLRCKKCGIRHQRPITFLLYFLEGKYATVFFKNRLNFCDRHVREKEINSLKNLGKVIEALSNK